MKIDLSKMERENVVVAMTVGVSLKAERSKECWKFGQHSFAESQSIGTEVVAFLLHKGSRNLI